MPFMPRYGNLQPGTRKSQKMIRMKRLTMTCLVSVVCLVSSIAFAQEGSNEGPVFAKTKPIRIAVEFTTHSACAHIANQKGWYKKEGLTISSYENFITGMALAAALARGDIDAAYICLIPAINAKANANMPIKIVAGIHKYG
jgi:NitT/TauT family transport system substrate-binding protein